MGLVNLDYVIPGEEVTDESVNRQTRALGAQLNGNIDTTNLKDGAVTTSKIADEAVTGPKIASETITSTNINFTTFPKAITSSGTSISVPPGTWLVFHTMAISQIVAAQAAVLLYTINGDIANRTWAVPSNSGQNFYSEMTDLGVVNPTTTTSYTRTTTTNTNIVVPSEKWIAIPINT